MSEKIKIVSVDSDTVSYGDLDFASIKALGDVSFYSVMPPEELAAVCADTDVLLVNKANVTRELVQRCPRLKYVGTYSTGFNNIDVQALNERGIVCSNVPGYSTAAVSQHVFALLLMYQGATDKYAASVAQGDWIKSGTFCYFPWRMHELYGKTFGVYGYGNIGSAVAAVAAAFGMNVIVYTRTTPKNCPYRIVTQEEIFRQSDYLSLHCPLNEGTAGIINAKTLDMMKPTAVLINTARGGLVDEVALADALNAGKIGGACLDTIATEPMTAECPLIGAKNCIITPHVAWGPLETRARLVEMVADNLRAFLNGSPINVVTAK